MRRTTIIDLPAEVLSEIFTQRNNPAIWETCKTFATVAFSTTSLWTNVHIGPRQFTTNGPGILRERILRTKGQPLDVIISLNWKGTNAEVSALCKVLSEFNTQIRSFKLTALNVTTVISGRIVHDVFPKSEAVMPALEVLSVLSRPHREDICDSLAVWPQLSLVLVNASTMFPNLRKLRMNIFWDAVPLLPSSASFSHLTELIFDGSLELSNANPSLIAAFLHCTPQLESLWMKHELYGTSAWLSVKGRCISKNIQLPKLKHLAVSTPGTACELMGCITAPALEDLHLDASRMSACVDWPVTKWDDRIVESVYNMLKLFASRCQNVRRFAITEVYLSEGTWDWLLFGEDWGSPPFPKLECIALHGVNESMCEVWSGFDQLLMEKFARHPTIPLKRLALIYCHFPLPTSVLVDVFRASGAKELGHSEYIDLWQAGEMEEFEKLGVSLRWESDDDEWWNLGHQTDVTDSKAY